jgi:hypothetical protein
MDLCHELFSWPTVIWTGTISLIGLTLTLLTLTDNKPCPKWLKKVGEYFDLQSETKKKKGKR